MSLSPARSKELIWCLIGFTGFVILLATYAFFNVKCLSYPWWYSQGSDGDGTYVTQTLALLNNGDLRLVFHPGATVYGIHGLIYNILIFFFKPFHSFIELAKMSGPAATFDMLDLAMRTSRVIMVVLHCVGMLVFWRLLFQLTKSQWLSYSLAVFFFTARFMYERIFIIRPEIVSFIFCALMLSVVIDLNGRKGGSLKAGVFWGAVVGMMAGFACLAKTHVVPELACIAVFWLFFRSGLYNGISSKKIAGLALGTAVINLCIMPWGWLKRPDFLVNHLKNLYFANEEHTLYGNIPATVAPVFLVPLVVLLFVAVIVFLKNKDFPDLPQVMLKLNLLITGVILSCYLVFAGMGMTFASYAAAVNNLLYSTVANVMFCGPLNHRVIDLTTFQRIWDVHGSNTFLGINVLCIVGVVTVWSMVRVCQKRTAGKWRYYLALLFLGIGFMMDIMSSFRSYGPGACILSWYAIYSLAAYVCGIGIWLTAFAKRKIIYLFLAVHVLVITVQIANRYTIGAGDVGKQTADQEMLNTMSAVRTFWHIASQGQITSREP